MPYNTFEELEVYKLAREFRDEQYFPEDYLNNLKQDAYEINKRLNGYISYLKRKKQEDTQSTSKPIN